MNLSNGAMEMIDLRFSRTETPLDLSRLQELQGEEDRDARKRRGFEEQ